MNTHKDKGEEKYKNWDDPVAIAFDKVGRRGVQYKKTGNTAKLFKRIVYLEFQLKSKYPEVFTEQKHCSSDYPSERAYWHYGYLMALKDIVKQFELKEIKT